MKPPEAFSTFFRLRVTDDSLLIGGRAVMRVIPSDEVGEGVDVVGVDAREDDGDAIALETVPVGATRFKGVGTCGVGAIGGFA